MDPQSTSTSTTTLVNTVTGVSTHIYDALPVALESSFRADTIWQAIFSKPFEDYEAMNDRLLEDFDSSKRSNEPYQRGSSNVKIKYIQESFLPWNPVNGCLVEDYFVSNLKL